MKKYLVTIEFTYNDGNNKTTTIGVYDTFEDAIVGGNNALKVMEANFNLHIFPDGKPAYNNHFGKTNGAFNSPKTLVTNLAYLKTPFWFCAKITDLDFSELQETINKVNEEVKTYQS